MPGPDYKDFGLGAIAFAALMIIGKVIDRLLPKKSSSDAQAEVAALRDVLDKIVRTLDMFAVGTQELPSVIRSIREISLELVNRHENVTKVGLDDIRKKLNDRFDRLEKQVEGFKE